MLERLEEVLKNDSTAREKSGDFDPATEPNPKPLLAQDIRRACLMPRKLQKLKELEREYENEMSKINEANQLLGDLMKEYSQVQAQVDSVCRLGVDECQTSLDEIPVEEISASISSVNANIR